ncbi:zinc-dependent alcohol dehydrogenase [Aureibacillus halotolerans]|uniref:2-desacetyl-2-hydroxyethyl bacteriochlorophyllide A dehydrogenase n=1 Tax=Aureibacillus halotolerans TaxID=1508390 RepID=A0A4R6U413_9BACI|nr:zinc-binding alcohol dehydrogenase [Aureibacillus halotolerans]TDQ41228.1 2-desacetyl-2-hydroxyethyl bacteriochlorophyllide A dehydrogenase [Aureibacillus halotolerans]
MNNQQIVFTAPGVVEWRTEAFDRPQLKATEVLVKKRFSLISPGTELACLSGGEQWFQMPQIPGYAAVSTVIEVGADVEHVAQGDLVFHYGKHCTYEIVRASELVVHVPNDLEPSIALFARLATVAFTALRVSEIELGDQVAVTGLGLVGNFAAQLAQLQGGVVTGMDLSKERVTLAQRCGIKQAVLSFSDIGPKKFNTFIEATGQPQVLHEALSWVAPFGECILLGTPRTDYTTNLTDVLRHTHLHEKGSVTLKGAHEWRYPMKAHPYEKHSMERNTRIVFELMRSGQLHVAPLISHMLKPQNAKEAYQGLSEAKEDYIGVLFDWVE